MYELRKIKYSQRLYSIIPVREHLFHARGQVPLWCEELLENLVLVRRYRLGVLDLDLDHKVGSLPAHALERHAQPRVALRPRGRRHLCPLDLDELAVNRANDLVPAAQGLQQRDLDGSDEVLALPFKVLV